MTKEILDEANKLNKEILEQQSYLAMIKHEQTELLFSTSYYAPEPDSIKELKDAKLKEYKEYFVQILETKLDDLKNRFKAL